MSRFLQAFSNEIEKLGAFAPETTNPDAYDGSAAVAAAMTPGIKAAKLPGATSMAPRTNSPSAITSPSEMLGRIGGGIQA